MKIHLHKNATTTPAQRAYIQNNPHLSVACLAEKTGVSKTTVRRWRNRSDVFDRPHTPKQIKTALTPIEEAKIILCRLATRSGLDDLNQIAQFFLGINCSRASLNRCLKRYHISRLPALRHAVPFDLRDYTGTYLYYTCFHLPAFSEGTSPVLFHTLLDCTFRTFHADFTSRGEDFLARHIQDSPLRVLGIIYTDPIVLTPGEIYIPKQSHSVESWCRSFNLGAHHIDIQYTKTIQRLNDTITSLCNDSVPVSWESPWLSETGLKRTISRYNTRFPLSALKRQTPREAIETHYTHFPNSFQQKPEVLAANL